MNAMPENIAHAASICAICHDQCVSACPIVAATGSLSAYPSRLAMVSQELALMETPFENGMTRILANCVGCNACTTGCVHVDNPNDITQVVRWSRRLVNRVEPKSDALTDLIEKTTLFGNPYGNLNATFKQVNSLLPRRDKPGQDTLLLCVDAPTLHYAPQIARSAIFLLEDMGYRSIRLSRILYHGWELWQNGEMEQLAVIAEKVIKEIEQVNPTRIVVVNPSTAYLMREGYHHVINANEYPVPITLAQLVIDSGYSPEQKDGVPPYVVISSTEAFYLRDNAAAKVVNECYASGDRRVRCERDEQIMYVPDGEFLGLPSTVREKMVERIRLQIAPGTFPLIVSTTPYLFAADVTKTLNARVQDFASYIISGK